MAEKKRAQAAIQAAVWTFIWVPLPQAGFSRNG
jgi:hypothetical protein